MTQAAAHPSTLLLTTFKYPYANGEPFLTAELPYLKAQFTRIIVQPVMGAPERRDLPDGFELCPPLYQGKDQKAFAIKALLDPAVWKIALAERRQLRRSGYPADWKRLLAWAAIRNRLEQSEGVRRLLAATGPKAAYSYWGHTPALASGLFARAGIPFAIRFHRVDLYEYGAHNYTAGKSPLQSFPWRRDMEAAARLVFISDHGRDYFGDRWGGPGFADQAAVSRLGTPDAGRCRQAPRAGTLVLASCSRITQVKQVHLIARLAAELARRGHQVEWHHFGTGDDAPSLQAIEDARGQDGLSIHMHGWVENAELMAFYRTTAVDLFVNLSKSEGIPVSIMEAVSFGIPVLATAVDGTPEAVVDGRSGSLCSLEEAQDSARLADKAEALLAPARPAGLDPRALWEERFDAERNFAGHAAGLAALAGSADRT